MGGIPVFECGHCQHLLLRVFQKSLVACHSVCIRKKEDASDTLARFIEKTAPDLYSLENGKIIHLFRLVDNRIMHPGPYRVFCNGGLYDLFLILQKEYTRVR